MGREALKLSFWAIVVYLAVAYGTSFGNDISSSATGGVNLVKAFQGR